MSDGLPIKFVFAVIAVYQRRISLPSKPPIGGPKVEKELTAPWTNIGKICPLNGCQIPIQRIFRLIALWILI